MEVLWGLLGPECGMSIRRVRTLGLGAAVRYFNNRAVPGVGGVWFGRQVLLALVGIYVAQSVRSRGKPVRNIETANAVEALACMFALESNGHQSDQRLRGVEKLRNKSNRSFSLLRRPGFYVSQPMRMAAVQALATLGLVRSDSGMFNAYECAQAGWDFLKDAGLTGPCYYSKSALDVLCDWAVDGGRAPNAQNKLSGLLSPLEPLPAQARGDLADLLTRGGGDDAKRRKDVLVWAGELAVAATQPVTWSQKPDCLSDEHWRDLHTGASFFLARDAALDFLDSVEVFLGEVAPGKCLSLGGEFPDALEASADRLRKLAQDFLDLAGDGSPQDMASVFCRECAASDPVTTLRALVERDGRCLRRRGEDIFPGPAFLGGQAAQGAPAEKSEADEEGAGQTQRIDTLPPGISFRIHNMFLFRLDLTGELGTWLKPTQKEEGEHVQ